MNAHDRMSKAQAEMTAINADTRRIQEFSTWLESSDERVRAFLDYYQGQWCDDREHTGASDFEVAGEDLPYETIVMHHEALNTLVRRSVTLLTNRN